jgi:hypothetical protein
MKQNYIIMMYKKIVGLYLTNSIRYNQLVKICNNNKKVARLILHYLNNFNVNYFDFILYEDKYMLKILKQVSF